MHCQKTRQRMIEFFFLFFLGGGHTKQNIINEVCKDFELITALNLLQVLPLPPLFFLPPSFLSKE